VEIEGDRFDSHRELHAAASSDFGQLCTHGSDGFRIVRGLEYAGAGNECVCTGVCHCRDVVDLHATVHFEPDLPVQSIDAIPHCAQLVQCVADELLTAKPRVYRHDQHQVELGQHVVEICQRCTWIEDQPGPAAALLDQMDGSIHVLGRLRVE